MKKFMHIIRSAIRPAGAVIVLAVALAACKKDSFQAQPAIPAAGLMAFNLAEDQPAVGFALSGNNLGNSALGYTGYTGVYLPIFTGNREVRSFDYNAGSTLAITNAGFADSNYYSAFLLGRNGNYRNVVVNDNLQPLTATNGKAWVRYINAVPDSTTTPAISITAGGDSPVTELAAYATVSDFRQVTAGEVTTAINNGSSIGVTRTITLAENTIYTLLFTGVPGSPDSTRAVQIKFVKNGTVAP